MSFCFGCGFVSQHVMSHCGAHRFGHEPRHVNACGTSVSSLYTFVLSGDAAAAGGAAGAGGGAAAAGAAAAGAGAGAGGGS